MINYNYCQSSKFKIGINNLYMKHRNWNCKRLSFRFLKQYPKISIWLFLAFLMLISSCQNKKEKEAAKIVTEWIGKEIRFPKNIRFSILGKDTTCTDLVQKPFKILLYADSTGCLSCRLKLLEWESLIDKTDSMASGKVGFVFIFQPKREKELQHLLKQHEFHYPVVVDLDDEFNKLNHFPEKQIFQCFLLNQQNKVLLVGNPVHNPQIWKLYKAQITGQRDEKMTPLTTIQITTKELDLGRIKIKEKTTGHFLIKNSGEKPFVIYSAQSSCGCTQVDFEKAPLKQGKSTEINIIMTPDSKGFFHKTVEVYSNTKDSPIQLSVKGIAE